jgi:hypothetical protein
VGGVAFAGFFRHDRKSARCGRSGAACHSPSCAQSAAGADHDRPGGLLAASVSAVAQGTGTTIPSPCMAGKASLAPSVRSNRENALRGCGPTVLRRDSERHQKAGIPAGIEFQTKPATALGQIRQAMEQKTQVGVVLADAAYGIGTQFRATLSELGLQYTVAIESSTTIWEPGQQPLPAPPQKPRRGAPPKRLQRSAGHLPVSAKQLAFTLPSFGLEGHRLAAG